MTQADLRLLAKLERLMQRMRPDLVRAFLRTYEAIKRDLTDAGIRAYVESIDQMLGASIVPDKSVQAAFREVRLTLRAGVGDSFTSFSRDMPQGAVGFDILNPKMIEGIQKLESRVITEASTNVRLALRQHVQAGIEAGKGPRDIARGLRDVVGLSPSQEQYVRNYRAELESGVRGAHRKLRDKRFDNAKLTPEKIDKMVDAYRKRWVAHNAETHARTAALDAQKLGQHLAWRDAVDRGDFPAERIRRTWVDSDDERVRPEHKAMDGETVSGLETPFSNGQVIPGQTDWQCRCIERIYVARQARAA